MHVNSFIVLPRPAAIGTGVTLLAVAAMAVDHMLEAEGGFAADPPMFAISVALCTALAAYLFGRVVPRAAASREGAGRSALVLAGVAVLSVTTFFVGLPFVVAGAAVAVGVAGLHGSRRRAALAATVIGALVLLLGTVVYVAQAVDKLG